jgi:PAS domain S-box-containing protein
LRRWPCAAHDEPVQHYKEKPSLMADDIHPADGESMVPARHEVRAASSRRSRRSLRRTLLLMLFAPVAPLLVVCAAAVWYQWQSQIELVYESLTNAANTIAVAVDREIDHSKAVLETLAASRLIDARDWRAFHALASDAIGSDGDSFIALTEPSGAQPVRTMLPYGKSPPVNPLAYARASAEQEWNGRRIPVSTQGLARRVFDTGRMSNSGLYYGVSVKKPAVSIAVPVVREGRVAYVLIMGFTVDRLVKLMQEAASPQTRLTIIDGDGRIIARSWKPEEGIGVSIKPGVAGAIRESDQGVRQGVNLSGERTVGAFRRLRLVDWSVYYSMPQSVALARATRGVLIWSLIGIGFLGLGLWGARRLWLRLAPPLAMLGQSARAIQRGEASEMPASDIAEIDELASLLRDAAAAEQREREEATRRRIAEESERATRRLVDALSLSESRFRTLFEHSGIGIASVDLSTGRFVLVNRRLCEITGYDEAELLRLTPADITREEDRATDADTFREFVTGQRPDYDAEKQYVHKNGELRWVRLHLRHFPGGSGQGPLGFVSILDVTKPKQAELALKAADRRKDEFLATLAHELRNPLAPLRSGIDILKLRNQDPATVTRIHVLMERQVRHMVRLIDDLLDVSRITTGRLQLQKTTLDLGDVLHAAAEACRSCIDEAGHRLSIAVEDAPVLVEGDSTRLIQVVENLLTNAAKYSERPGEIAVVAFRREGKAVLSVRDNGIGLPPDKLHVIFDMFSQVHGHRGSGKDRGLGIGLHLVKRLVELHDGTVVARSEGEGRGSEFIIELPLSEATHAIRGPVPEIVSCDGSLRILVVDDNVDAAESLARLLEISGHDVETACSGEEALETIARHDPQLVLLDLGMPEMDGYELARRIHAMPSVSRPFIVAISGWGQPEDKKRTALAGFDRHLVKPVEFMELQEVIRGACRRAVGEAAPASAPGR